MDLDQRDQFYYRNGDETTAWPLNIGANYEEFLGFHLDSRRCPQVNKTRNERGRACGWAEKRGGKESSEERRSLDGSIKSSSLRDNSSRETGEERRGGLVMHARMTGKKGAEIEEICTWTKSLTREREENTRGIRFRI